jgi:hypothetical protein
VSHLGLKTSKKRSARAPLAALIRVLRPTFDASLALEFLGFSRPEATEGLASHLEKRKPSFPPTSAI